MNTKNGKLIALVLIIILLLILFYLFKDKTNSSQGGIQTDNATTKNQVGEPENKNLMSGSIFDLVKAGNNVTCTFSNEDENYTMSGTSYISGKKMRVDSTTNMIDQEPITSHMISDGEWFYSWTNVAPQGMKMKVEEAEKSSPSVTAPSNGVATKAPTEQYNTNYDFDCKKWNPDETKFTLPTDVEFLELSQLLPPSSGGACSACGYIEDPAAKEQCLATLNCK